MIKRKPFQQYLQKHESKVLFVFFGFYINENEYESVLLIIYIQEAKCLRYAGFYFNTFLVSTDDATYELGKADLMSRSLSSPVPLPSL